MFQNVAESGDDSYKSEFFSGWINSPGRGGWDGMGGGVATQHSFIWEGSPPQSQPLAICVPYHAIYPQ